MIVGFILFSTNYRIKNIKMNLRLERISIVNNDLTHRRTVIHLTIKVDPFAPRLYYFRSFNRMKRENKTFNLWFRFFLI